LAVNSLIVNPNGAMLRFTIQPFTSNLPLANSMIGAVALSRTRY